MDGESSFRHRFGGHLLLVTLALLLLVGGQMHWSGASAGTGSQSPAAGLPLPAATADAAPTVTLESLPETVFTVLDVPAFGDTGLSPALNPRTYHPRLPAHTFQTYRVERGDTPNRIAEKHGISPATLLGGNPWLSQESNLLQSGVELIILPVDGVLHTVRPGETLEVIAGQYDVPVADIIAYPSNNLEFPYRLYADTELLIPGAQIGVFYWTAPKSVAGSGGPGGTQWAVIGTGTFFWPVAGRCITSYYWFGHPGLDVSLREGTPVYAADRGTITYASWAADRFFDYGNLIVINHGNGYETFYAHLSTIAVYPGQTVEQGQVIGASGNTGRSSGPHLHFEIRLNDYRDNPLSYLSGPTQNCAG